MAESIKFYNPDFNGFENCEDNEYLEVQAKFEVCPRCRGKGTHVNPSIDGNGLTREDFDQDPDFMEDYLSGVYDVQCYECKGQRVVLVPDRENADPTILSLYDKHIQEDLEYEQMCAAERRYLYGPDY